MRIWTALRCATVLVFGMALIGGCKKEPAQQAEAPKTEPAPAAAPAPAPVQQAGPGEALFQKHCAVCHPNGGNTIKPEYTLHSKALAAHNITKPEDIVKIMRNPGAGMTKFDATVIPDSDATAIAEYVLVTFK